VSAKRFTALKRAEARARVASVRRGRKNRRAALIEQRHASLVRGASRWQVTNLASVLQAMA
jgi:hypothetical protein